MNNDSKRTSKTSAPISFKLCVKRGLISPTIFSIEASEIELLLSFKVNPCTP